MFETISKHLSSLFVHFVAPYSHLKPKSEYLPLSSVASDMSIGDMHVAFSAQMWLFHLNHYYCGMTIID